MAVWFCALNVRFVVVAFVDRLDQFPSVSRFQDCVREGVVIVSGTVPFLPEAESVPLAKAVSCPRPS